MTGGTTVTPRPSSRAQRLQQRRVARAPAPEAEVVADDDLARAQVARQHLAHERLGLDGRERARERLDDRDVDARRVEQLEPPLERHDQRRRPGGREQAGGVGVEGQHGRRRARRRAARARASRSSAWCPRCTPSKLPMATASGAPARADGGDRAGRQDDPHGRARQHDADRREQRLELERLLEHAVVRHAQRGAALAAARPS